VAAVGSVGAESISWWGELDIWCGVVYQASQAPPWRIARL
jgi:hypothetical protein